MILSPLIPESADTKQQTTNSRAASALVSLWMLISCPCGRRLCLCSECGRARGEDSCTDCFHRYVSQTRFKERMLIRMALRCFVADASAP